MHSVHKHASRWARGMALAFEPSTELRRAISKVMSQANDATPLYPCQLPRDMNEGRPLGSTGFGPAEVQRILARIEERNTGRR